MFEVLEMVFFLIVCVEAGTLYHLQGEQSLFHNQSNKFPIIVFKFCENEGRFCSKGPIFSCLLSLGLNEPICKG